MTGLLGQNTLVYLWGTFSAPCTQLPPRPLNKHFFRCTIIWSESQEDKEQSDDQGLIYTLILCEGHPLIYLQTTASHTVVQMSDG